MKKLFKTAIAATLAAVTTFGFVSCKETTKFTGFDIELSKKVVEYLNETYDVNLKIEFTEIDWNSKEALLENGSIDLVWNGMTITPERSEEMCISLPYLYNKQVAVVRAEDKATYTDLASMANANVGAETGSAGEGVISDQDIGGEYITAPSQLDALVSLDNGSIDVAVIDLVMAGYYTANGAYKGKLVIVEDLVLAQEEYYGIAAKKGNEAFMSKINEALLALIDTDYKTVAQEFGLTGSCSLSADMVNSYASATDNSWNEIVSSGKIIIGYTVFAPIAYNA